MLTDALFHETLLNPVTLGGDHLFIVSGYATPTMASQHLSAVITQCHANISLELIVGMTPVSGMDKKYHLGFQELVKNNTLGTFSCSYVMSEKKPVHSKVYLWMRHQEPFLAYMGSANYTHNAFWGAQREALTECDPISAWDYYQSLRGDTIFCDHGEVEDYVLIPDSMDRHQEAPRTQTTPDVSSPDLDHVECSLLQRNGEIHQTAGLNWGQRTGRNHNQAYIPVPASISRTDFFPPMKTHFIIVTDDRKDFIGVIAQGDLGKAIETPTNNGLLGEYFRNRLGLPNGAFVTKGDLERYGRTTVTFHKIDDDTYYMDFSQP